MKTLNLISGVALGSFIIFGGMVVAAQSASADNGPHIKGTGSTTVDGCAGCHRAHTAQSANLITKSSEVLLCNSCHSAGLGALTDVQMGMYYPDFSNGSEMLGLRGGGFTTAAIDSTHAVRTSPKTVPGLATPEAVTSTHSVDGTTQTAWGNGANGSGNGSQISLKCTSCHDPHGNGNYRILKPIPTDSGATAGITIPDSAVKVYTTSNYWLTDDPNSPLSTPRDVTSSSGTVTTYTPTVFIDGISAWCSTCHTRYLAPAGSAETPSGDSVFMYRHRSDQNYKAGGANCITCHVSHGSNAKMTGTESGHVPLPSGAAAPAGDSRLLRVDNRGTCNMCHNK
jgi:predicted CXXCH cytochrome family protein